MAKNIYIYEHDDLKTLELSSDICQMLRDQGLSTVGDVWILNRKKLKAMGFKDADIKIIIIKLQLLGLDLNKKIYN